MHLNAGGRIFVDSGAFGAFCSSQEMDFEGRVFPVYDALLARGTRAQAFMLLMPDVVGDASATQALQRRHRYRILGWLDLGAECVFPLQDARSDVRGQFAQVAETLAGRPFVVGIPSKAAAWSPQQTVDFAAAVRPPRMHLIGRAKDCVVRAIAEGVHAVSPHTRLSCDSCLLLAHVGVGRRLTDRAQERVEDAVEWLAQGAWLDEQGKRVADTLLTRATDQMSRT